MNELQLALVGAGVLAVASVWIYNALQERKHRKRAEAIFKGGQEDVLAAKISDVPYSVARGPQDSAGIRREPGLGTTPDPVSELVAPASHGPVSAIEPVCDVEETPEQTVTATTAMPSSHQTNNPELPSRNEPGPDDLLPWVDLLADCAVGFSLPSPVNAAGLWAAQSSWKGGVGKPIHLLGRVTPTGPWTYAKENSAERFSHWLIALQLVDRSGPVSDAGLARFIDGLQQISRHVGVEIMLPGRSEMLMRAQDLDRFCASVDIQFSLSVVSAQSGPFAGTKLRGVCEAAGLMLESDGLYHYRNAAGECEFTLGNLGNESFDVTAMSSLATHGVSLTIDVPRVADGVAAFNRMVLVARQLAQGLGGTLVDANRAALSDGVIATIRSKIGEVQQVLHKAGIVPGSQRALRLFS